MTQAANRRIVLGIQYDGGPWQGWQTQRHGQTVQDALEAALLRFALTPLEVVCAGRTDSGVHALEQVVHFDTTVVRDAASWVRGVNAFLPTSIAVRWACELSPQAPAEMEAAAGLAASGSPYAREDGFHARFSAIARTYHYLLYNHPVRSPLLAGRVGWVFRPLDLQNMREGAGHLVGTHDFSAFRSIECQAKTPVRSMHTLDIAQSGDMFIFTLCANAFLHHMVRNIVGSLIMVGQGKQAPDWVAEVLAQRDRSKAAPTFMADGLYLARVDYPAQWQSQLPQQRTRDGWPWGQDAEALRALIL
ncbi:MAG TPA: tRNA pseudouridine synthase A [Herbaspirillum sp.]|jgi:tRNA pseudouridine38-40 synthase